MQLVLVSATAAGAAFGVFLITSPAAGPTPLSIGAALVLLSMAGLAIGAGELLLACAARQLVRRVSRRTRRDTVLAVSTGALLSPVCWLLIAKTLGGRYARSLPGHDWLVALGTALLLVLVVTAVLFGLRLGPRLLAASRSEDGRVAWLAVALLVAGAGVLALERILLVRRYDAIHGALNVVGFLLLQGGSLFLLDRAVRRRTRVAAGILVAVAGAGMMAVIQLHRPERSDLRRALVSVGFAGDQLLHFALATGAMPRTAPIPFRIDEPSVPTDTGVGLAPLAGADLVLITVDALRADHLGLHGYHRPTSPALDQLARRAVVFEQAYAPTPHTSFSLTSLLTGRHGWSLGRARKLDGLPTLADAYRRAGHLTVGVFPPAVFFVESELFRGYERRSFGFEHAEVQAHDETADAAARTDQAIRWIEAAGRRPLFLWVHYFGPHEPYVQHPGVGSPAFGRRDVDRYDEEIQQVDREIGRLLDHVTRRRPGAVVVVTADHGEEFGEHGGSYHGTTLFDEQLRVPLILAVPGMPARRVATPVSTVDLVPTLVELTGVGWPAALDGSSLTAPMIGARSRPRDVFAELDGIKMIRRGEHKLLCDVTRDFCRLYDLTSDPRERRDVAERFPKLREELRSALLSWLQRAPAASSTMDEVMPAGEALLERAARFETEAIARLGELLERAPGGQLSPSRLRLGAAELMARLRHPGKTLALSSILTADPDPDVRAWAAIGLGLEGRTDVAPALAAVQVREGDHVKRAYRALALHATESPDAAEELAAVLPSVDEVTLRCRLIQALGDSKNPRALPTLQEAYPVIRSRICVARAFAALQSPAALPFLQARLAEEPYSHVRSALAEAIARSDGSGAVPILRELFRTETEEIVIAATARLLVQLGVGLPVARRKPVAVPSDARELWLVPAGDAGASLRVRWRDGGGRGTARRIEAEGGRPAYALSLVHPKTRGRPMRAFAPRGHALFR